MLLLTSYSVKLIDVERISQSQVDPAGTEEALMAEDVKADIYQDEGG